MMHSLLLPLRKMVNQRERYEELDCSYTPAAIFSQTTREWHCRFRAELACSLEPRGCVW
jgi:hypothetical protein